MSTIPKIVHQIWGGEKQLPKHFQILSETWKRDYPDWKYEFWDDERINKFVRNYYPQYYEYFMSFPYDMQRWDSARYLILNKMGGMHVDFDYESISSIESLIEGETCCFALDPDSHRRSSKKELMLNGALMLSTPNHWFLQRIIKTVFTQRIIANDNRPKSIQIYTSAGPWMLVETYYNLSEEERKSVFLLSDKLVTPLSARQSQRFIRGEMCKGELQYRLKDAYAVHYFFGDWR